MKKTAIAIALAAASATAIPAYADAGLSGNFSVTSDYRFRGVSQSNLKPAVQGGIDYNFSNGFYVGNWNSSVSDWTSANGAGLEMDFYGGFATELGGLGLDIGAIYYYYPGQKGNLPDTKNTANTQEIYLGLSYGPVSFTTSYTLSKRYFTLGRDGDTSLQVGANPSSKGTLYYDLSFEYEIAPKTTLTAHAGLLDLKNKSGKSLKDYSIGISYDLGDNWAAGLTYYNTSFDSVAKDSGFFVDQADKKLYKSGAAVSISKTF
jgi:uncharacterized protein (TIGR02001 family)